jgi:hypothetical protein
MFAAQCTDCRRRFFACAARDGAGPESSSGARVLLAAVAGKNQIVMPSEAKCPAFSWEIKVWTIRCFRHHARKIPFSAAC